MIDLSNLYANFTSVCAGAAVHELEIMLRVLRNRLEQLHPHVAVHLTAGLVLLDQELAPKRTRLRGGVCVLKGCERWHDAIGRHALPPE